MGTDQLRELKQLQKEKERLLIAEKQEKSGQPLYAFDHMFEPAMQFLANPWKLWESGNLHL